MPTLPNETLAPVIFVLPVILAVPVIATFPLAEILDTVKLLVTVALLPTDKLAIILAFPPTRRSPVATLADNPLTTKLPAMFAPPAEVSESSAMLEELSLGEPRVCDPEVYCNPDAAVKCHDPSLN